MSKRELTARIRTAIECAEALVPARADIQGRLAHNALEDPSPGVRLRCLAVLLPEFGDFQETDTVLARIRSGDDMLTGLAAAVASVDGEGLDRAAPHVQRLSAPISWRSGAGRSPNWSRVWLLIPCCSRSGRRMMRTARP